MATSKSPLVFSLLFILSLFTGAQSQNFVCPDSTSISPCTCEFNPSWPTLSQVLCKGPDVTLDHLTLLFTSLRQLNNISSSPGSEETLYIPNFSLSSTNLTTLDLHPFINMEFGLFGVFQNPLLTSIQPPTNSTDQEIIESFRFYAVAVDFTQTSLEDKEASTILKFLKPSATQQIEFGSMKIKGSEGESIEFIEGLSAFTNVYSLILSQNEIQKLGQGLFSQLIHLTFLGLADNPIEEIGPNSFFFNQSDFSDLQFNIDLRGTGLTDEKIHPDHGFQFIGRPIALFLERNQFEFISRENFEPFLLADERNALRCWENIFICDSRMQWLRDQREKFELRVEGILCENDPGKTIFTTDLLP